MEATTDHVPSPAACLTVLALLNPLNLPHIPVPREGWEDLSRLPPSLRPLLLKIFQTFRSKNGSKAIPVGEFRVIYERMTAMKALVVRAVEPAKKPNRPMAWGKATRLSGENSPTRSLVTTAPSLASPHAPRLSLSTVTSTIKQSTPKVQPAKYTLSYTQQHHRKRNSELEQDQRDYKTAQSMVKSLNQSFTTMFNSQHQPSPEESRRDALLLVRKRHFEWSKGRS